METQHQQQKIKEVAAEVAAATGGHSGLIETELVRVINHTQDHGKSSEVHPENKVRAFKLPKSNAVRRFLGMAAAFAAIQDSNNAEFSRDKGSSSHTKKEPLTNKQKKNRNKNKSQKNSRKINRKKK